MVNVNGGKTTDLKTDKVSTLIESYQIDISDVFEPHIPDTHSEVVQPKGVVLNAMGEVNTWPYPIKYGEETEVVTNVLILSGRVADCHAAINATKLVDMEVYSNFDKSQ